MPGPLLTAGLMLAGNALANKAFPKSYGGQTKFKGINPAQYKAQLTVSDSQKRGLRSAALMNAEDGNMAAINSIKQIGAAGRLPKAATQANIAQVRQGQSETIAKLEPQLEEMQRTAFKSYLDKIMEYDRVKHGVDSNNNQISAGSMQDSIGALSKVLLLWQGGMLNNGGANVTG